jgi:hypothetical protein
VRQGGGKGTTAAVGGRRAVRGVRGGRLSRGATKSEERPEREVRQGQHGRRECEEKNKATREKLSHVHVTDHAIEVLYGDRALARRILHVWGCLFSLYV